MKVDNWALLSLHKGYIIPAATGIIRKLTQKYGGPFLIKKKVNYLAYKLDMPSN